jgi:hypothetical protein
VQLVVQVVVVVPLGGCQKFPQPANNGRTTRLNFANDPIFIPTPIVAASESIIRLSSGQTFCLAAWDYSQTKIPLLLKR